MGSYAQAYTLYSSVRPFGITAIIAGWDSEAELPVDGQVGSGPKVGSGGKKEGAKHGGPSLYMIEPSGLYWVCAEMSKCSIFKLIDIGLLWSGNGQGSTDRQIRA
jgi:20S proteasome alpha/beta subunit